MIESDLAFEKLHAITLSEVNTIPVPQALSDTDHPVDGQAMEYMIRARAISGIGKIAKSGHVDATNALLDIATNSQIDMLQSYAISDYLASGNAEERINTLRGVAPDVFEEYASSLIESIELDKQRQKEMEMEMATEMEDAHAEEPALPVPLDF